MMENKIEKLKSYTVRTFLDGTAFGVASSSTVAGVVSFIDNGCIDHPYLIGIPLLTSIGLGYYNVFKHGKDKGLNRLERELDLK